ncbi:transglycosylase domain-containing protein [Actinoplanes subglobosus]|uniref:Transglycosylase domain-containing protein n=1 Tax=Actinoplanes subglobosus TaxID=1547892 RepID=A0ABV8J2L4_9ACTN
MTLADIAPPVQDPAPTSPSRGRGRQLVVGASIALLLAAGGIIGATYYYDSVALPESTVTYQVVSVSALSPQVAQAFVAAVDPGFYESGDSLITQRYAVIAAGTGEESDLRTRIMARKAESTYTKEEILDRYLNRADFGRGAVGLVAAAQTYFGKPATQLTLAEAALLAVQLDPDHPAQPAGWVKILDIMVDHEWLTPAERSSLTYPG